MRLEQQQHTAQLQQPFFQQPIFPLQYLAPQHQPLQHQQPPQYLAPQHQTLQHQPLQHQQHYEINSGLSLNFRVKNHTEYLICVVSIFLHHLIHRRDESMQSTFFSRKCG
ncbi:hypothetical protein ACLKA7_005113 [Drosophila subpalustris]